MPSVHSKNPIEHKKLKICICQSMHGQLYALSSTSPLLKHNYSCLCSVASGCCVQQLLTMYLIHCLICSAQQNPSQRVNYPFLQPTLQGPHLPLPPLPPHYDSISKHPPPPPLTSIQQNAFRGIGVGSVNPKLQSSTAGQNFHVPSGVMVSADLMPKHSGQPPHSHGVAPTDSFQQKKAVINHLVGYERLGQAQGPPQPKAEMGVVPIMSTATSLPLQFPSVPIMGSEAPSRVGGIDLNGSRCPRSRKRMLSQSGQLPPGAELAGG